MQKSVFVTGACIGTGKAIAERFAKEGYDIFISGRNGDKAQDVAKEIAEKYGVKAKGYTMVTFDEPEIKEIFADIRENGYLLDALVLNAANLGIGQDTLSVDMSEFIDVYRINVFFNFIIARQAALQMKEKGKGSIVFINSNTAYRAIPSRAAYSSSKGAILSMSRALAIDLGKYGIRSNCVLPGMIKTERWYNNFNNCRYALSNYTPLGDIAEFEDIANAAWFFGSDLSRNATGSELVVDGGNMSQLVPEIPENK